MSKPNELYGRIAAEIGADWLTVREIMINVSRGWPEAKPNWIERPKIQYQLRKMERAGEIEAGQRPSRHGSYANIYRRKAVDADPA